MSSFYRNAIGVFIFIISTQLHAEGSCQYDDVTLSSSDSERILAATKRTIFTVSGNQEFSGNILRCDNLVFQDGARLILTSLDQEDIILRIKRLKINSPATRVYISRKGYDSSVLDGKGGSDMSAASRNKKGKKGNRGEDGDDGMSIPTLKIIIDSCEVDFGQVGEPTLVFEWEGIDGGNGGNGGNGQKGGKGNNGRNAKGNYLVCKSGPGNGKSGKRGGDGGDGGNAGNGGNGGTIIIMGECQAIERMSYAEFNQNGGRAGNVGVGGKVGQGGAGGRKGSTKGTRCDDDGRKNGKKGPDGRKVGKTGAKGKDGLAGKLDIFHLVDSSRVGD